MPFGCAGVFVCSLIVSFRSSTGSGQLAACGCQVVRCGATPEASQPESSAATGNLAQTREFPSSTHVLSGKTAKNIDTAHHLASSGSELRINLN